MVKTSKPETDLDMMERVLAVAALIVQTDTNQKKSAPEQRKRLKTQND
jgi:hypothetical protein